MTDEASILALANRIEKALVVSLVEPCYEEKTLPASANPLSDEQQKVIVAALRASAAPIAPGTREAISDALGFIKQAKELLVLAYKATGYKSKINLAVWRMTYAERALTALTPPSPSVGEQKPVETYMEYCMNEKCPRGQGVPVEIVRPLTSSAPEQKR